MSGRADLFVLDDRSEEERAAAGRKLDCLIHMQLSERVRRHKSHTESCDAAELPAEELQ